MTIPVIVLSLTSIVRHKHTFIYFKKIIGSVRPILWLELSCTHPGELSLAIPLWLGDIAYAGRMCMRLFYSL